MKFSIIACPFTNYSNVARLLRSCDLEVEIQTEYKSVKNSETLILSGNGSFGAYHSYLTTNKWDSLIYERLLNNAPIVTICAGMQILATKSAESPNIKGFGHFSGEFHKFEGNVTTNIGQRKINFSQNIEFSDIRGFFCHSYYYIPSREEHDTVLAYSDFSGIEFPAVIKKNNILGFQFHPELSGLDGSKFIKIMMKHLSQ